MQVSVAIPCYNGARFVGATIESVLGQTHPADEILVIDDGSRDDSAAIVRQYTARHRVTLIPHGQNQGLAAARNTAIDAARGEILAFIDVDAQADSQWLARLLAGYARDCLQAEATHSDRGPGDDAEIGGVGGAGIEAAGNSLADRWRHRYASQHHGEHAKERVDFLFGLNMSYRRSALQAVGGFSPTLRTNAEDMDMGYRLNRAGYRLVYRPDARVFHQRTDDLSSLRKTIYNWYFWAYVVKHKNGHNPWMLGLGTLRRLLWRDTLRDLLHHRQVRLAALSVEMSWIKLRALYAAAQYVRTYVNNQVNETQNQVNNQEHRDGVKPGDAHNNL